jgi:16S rRNA (cytosine1402-N4)-methyltransferase
VSSPGSGSDVASGHQPVLLSETMELLRVRAGGLYVDGTLGLAGHACEILRRSAPDGRLVAFDRDAETMERARETLAPFGERVRLVHADWRDLPRVLGAERPDGILLDLGVSSVQLDTAERGFSFQQDGPLDMRMDRSQGASAADVVNRTPETELADLIYRYGEERASRRIARAIVRTRERRHFQTTGELAAVVRSAAGRARRPGLDPATLTFQALRIHVNGELEHLGDALLSLADTLAPGGRMAVIAFHSLEDREVKQSFRAASTSGFTLLTKKPQGASPDEVRANPRSRSARLRAIARPEAA